MARIEATNAEREADTIEMNIEDNNSIKNISFIALFLEMISSHVITTLEMPTAAARLIDILKKAEKSWYDPSSSVVPRFIPAK